MLNETEKQFLRDLYAVHFGASSVSTHLFSWATSRGMDIGAASDLFDRLKSSGVAKISRAAGPVEITTLGILQAERDGIAPEELASENAEIRFKTLVYLETERKSRRFVPWKAPATAHAIDEGKLQKNLEVLKTSGFVEAPMIGVLSITVQGLKAAEREREHRALVEAATKVPEDQRNLSIRAMKLQVLKILAAEPQSHHHRSNVIGRPFAQGELERQLKRAIDDEERARAGRALQELERAGLIRPTYRDTAQSEQWIEITEAGRRALERGALDELDEVLFGLDKSFVDLREGAWAALESAQPDSLRQAAHSGRELIEQVLHRVAPDDEMKAESGFKPSPEAKSGITRSMRFKYARRMGRIRSSESNLRVAEAAERLVIEIDHRLTALAHSRESIPAIDVRDALVVAEIALRRLLLGTSDEEVSDEGAIT